MAAKVAYSIPQELVLSFVAGIVAAGAWNVVGSSHRNIILESKAQYDAQESALVEAIGSKIAQKVALERSNNDKMLALKAKFPTYDPKVGQLPGAVEAALRQKIVGDVTAETVISDDDAAAYAAEHSKMEEMLFMASHCRPWDVAQEIFVVSCMDLDDDNEIVFKTPENRMPTGEDDDE
jgi:hypothetical protein